MSNISKGIAIISGLCLHIAILLTVIFGVATNQYFYIEEYAEGNQASYIGMSDEDLMRSTNALLDYIKGDREDIVEVVTVNGYEREVFNSRETAHMVDVRNLYQNASIARWILFAIGIIGMVYTYLKRKKIADIQFGLKNSLLYLFIFIGFIAIWAIADFDNFWLQFHYVFFDNDLFLLDPNTSIMINMFPGELFYDLVMYIIGIFVLLEIAIHFILRKLRERHIYA